MIASVRQFFLVSILIIFGLGFTWFVLDQYGESRTLQEPMKHPFLEGISNQTPALISYEGDPEFPPNTLEGFDAAVAKNAQVLLWADVRPAADGTLMLFHDTDVSQSTDGTGWVDYISPADLARLNAGFKFTTPDGKAPFRDHPIRIPTLAQLLQRFPHQKMVLNFLNNRPGLDDKITSAIDAAKASDRVLIQSSEEGLMRDLRNERPAWIFGTSQARNTQLKMLASIGLASLATLNGDVYVTPYELGSNVMFNRDIRAELVRRRMPFFVGPLLQKTQDKSPGLSSEPRDEAPSAKETAHQLIRDGAAGLIVRDVFILSK